jgi:hypothetical protein
MRRLAPVLLLLGACRSAPPSGEPATLSLLGATGRLETWTAEAAEGGHLHLLPGAPCPAFVSLLKVGALALPDGRRPDVEGFSAALEGLTTAMFGRSYGGAGRVVLALRRLKANGVDQDEAIFVVLPALPEGPELRTWRAPEVQAEAVGAATAVLESGRVAARRLGGRRFEFELFLVFRTPDAERLQVVARVEAGAAR